ncbi:MAG: glycosyl transferase family 2 [Flavobacteriia bacterium]|nr:glycosyl transferase family 2 [Flavobacteriia bacterium]OIP46331.1 MAG: glycosyl transferase family 2 [Flavobacteriaceae bacterium CG2_30_31_66]PIV95699.1 MAG: glycosyl transferase family 2 [Flavobacteriaceae bacterium CG17_big_fil_post_rev_8_21_14_2_50_31_13]PIX12156.1 MAG: glycosyl transferase family 2 [Flavobacteriaceae bacterium CG_4_8_14_3_um_filter_31_8]PIY15597.1 MAG: glycosyl transferase family 2 [Flavobacteriaceae bacterium CG_4_10_14_3_um_filter_31_253]PIZ09268.1 MAG: glycosyl tra
MTENIFLTGSIVLFDENLSDLDGTINSFLGIPIANKKLYLIDNTTENFFEYVFVHENIEYTSNEKNIGFGSGHNRILNKISEISDYHLILNPDVSFEKSVIPNLILELKKHQNVAMIAPKVLFPDGSHQYSCRRYPVVIELLARRFKILKHLFENKVFRGEYREKELSKPFFAEYLTGCFQLYKTADFVKLNGFDERYFLYMEDVDICKKLDILGKKKLYYPQEQIIHVLKQGSLKNVNLFLNHLTSAIKYFLKWGF